MLTVEWKALIVYNLVAYRKCHCCFCPTVTDIFGISKGLAHNDAHISLLVHILGGRAGAQW